MYFTNFNYKYNSHVSITAGSAVGPTSYDRSTAARKLSLQPRPRPTFVPCLGLASSDSVLSSFKVKFSKELNRFKLEAAFVAVKNNIV